jgi:hypothetical protein
MIANSILITGEILDEENKMVEGTLKQKQDLNSAVWVVNAFDGNGGLGEMDSRNETKSRESCSYEVDVLEDRSINGPSFRRSKSFNGKMIPSNSDQEDSAVEPMSPLSPNDISTNANPKVEAYDTIVTSEEEGYVSTDNYTDETNSKINRRSILQFIFQHLTVYPHSYNAYKYSLAITVVLLGAYPLYSIGDYGYNTFRVFYFLIAVTSTIFSTYWDYVMDWGLFQKDSKYPYLRPRLLYDNPSSVGIYYYYFAIVINPLLRSMWTLSFTPWGIGRQSFLAVFELGRRMIWTSLRLEYYHLQNRKSVM